jgi:hypothetical protein
MGNGGSDYTPPPPTPMPIKDDVARNEEAAKLAARTGDLSSRTANDLNEANISGDAMTRSQVAKAETFAPQPAVRGQTRVSVAPATRAQSMGNSSVVTG